MTARSQNRFTPQEVAALVGVPLRRVQNAMTFRRLPGGASRGGRREVDLAGLLAFATAARLGRDIVVKPAALYGRFRRTGVPRKSFEIGPGITAQTRAVLGPILDRLDLYHRARSGMIALDPAIMGGAPVIKGTRIPARIVQARLRAGDTVAMLLAEYPYLTREQIAAAVLFADANPERGRPKKTARVPRRAP